MTQSLLLDTHIALWLDAGDEKLRRGTWQLIDAIRRGGGTIYLSAVSAWEIALLVDGGRIDLDLPAEDWVKRFLDRWGMAAAPLTPGAAARIYRLHQFEYRDPADRMLITTAVELGCPLVTYDLRIIEFAKRAGGQIGFQTLLGDRPATISG